MAAPPSTPSPSTELADGPVLSVVNKRIRALRKKLNRIAQMEESLAQGKSLNKEQEETLKSKTAIAAQIDELEKLRSPLSSALAEELKLHQSTSNNVENDGVSENETRVEEKRDDDRSLEDLISLLYLGSLFDVKNGTNFASMIVARETERQSCLSFDYVTDEVADDAMLTEPDLDLIASLGGLLISRPSNSSLPHKEALEHCVKHAKLWLAKADQPIGPEFTVTYAGLREKLKKIMASDFLTTKPELKDPVEVAAANYAHFQVPLHGNIAPVQVDSSIAQYELKDEPSEYHGNEPDNSQSNRSEDVEKVESVLDDQSEAVPSQLEQLKPQADVEQTQTDAESKEQQDYHRHVHQNPRGGRGGGRRGYSNGRGGRNGSRGGGPYQNGRNQYYDQSGNYYPRNYYNNRGRSGRGGGGHLYNHHGGAVQPGYSSASDDVGLAS